MKKIIFTLILSIKTIIIFSNNIDTSIKLYVLGNCEMCKERIENATKINGVKNSNWNIQSKNLSINFDKSQITSLEIENAILKSGHSVNNKLADSIAYNKLPECCLYKISKKNINSNNQDSIFYAIIMYENKRGNFIPFKEINVKWLETDEITKTNENGAFKLNYNYKNKYLLINVSDIITDTILINDFKGTQMINLKYKENKILNEIIITKNKPSTYISKYNTELTEIITEKELFKAACCNLSESFETNPSVDVSYSDALSGSKQIQMLGLSGIYTQLTLENLPGIRGLATSNGLNYISGTFIESMQLTKGIGSVVNGFESIAGQINVELHKPINTDKIYYNLYINDFGKIDANLNFNNNIGKNWKSLIMIHNDFLNNINIDFDKNGFRDIPTGNLFSINNRWQFIKPSSWKILFGVTIVIDNKTSGQINFNKNTDKLQNKIYGFGLETKRYEGFMKIGYIFANKKYKSIGLQLSSFNHINESFFGLNIYNANQKNLYYNLIYQSIILNTNHKFRTGFSFVFDEYSEQIKNLNFYRQEFVSGFFYEYTYTNLNKLQIVTGLRADYNNLYGMFYTPRLNIKYDIFKNTILRLSTGRGQRTANIFAENTNTLASSREIQIITNNTFGAYNLLPEIAWNNGISLQQKINIFNKIINLNIDFFRTDFTNQVIIDLENPRYIKFYNLTGISFSNSFQSEIQTNILNNLDIRFAYRFLDVKQTLSNNLLQKPLISQQRILFNIDYTLNSYNINITTIWNGSKRLPSTKDNSPEYQQPEFSQNYFIINSQISKTFGKKYPFDIYFGVENINDFFQSNSIIAPTKPFEKYFDASLIWAPIFGRMFYTGIRMKIK